MGIPDNFEDLVSEIQGLSEKAARLVSRTKRVVDSLENQTKVVLDQMQKIKKTLGIQEKVCPICANRCPTHCVDTCHHMYCYSCASRCLRPPSKCFVCRQTVTAIFKVFV